MITLLIAHPVLILGAIRSAAVPPLVLGMCDPCPTPTPSPADPMLGTLWNRVSAMEDTIQNTLPYPPDSM